MCVWVFFKKKKIIYLLIKHNQLGSQTLAKIRRELFFLRIKIRGELH